MATVRRAGPPVPPRPQAILLKTRNIATYSNRSTGVKSCVSATATTPEDGRTVVYKSPSFNLQKRQEQREKRYSFNTADGNSGCSSVVIERGYAPPQLHAKPTVASKKPKPTAPVPMNAAKGDNSFLKNNSVSGIDNHRTEVVIVANNNNESPVSENAPLPKPRTLISKSPGGFLRRSKTTLDNFTRSTITIASISNGDNNNNDTDSANGNTHSRITNGFMSGKTFDIKNNLKNAAERLFSEIVSHSKDSKNKTPPPIHRSESWKFNDDSPSIELDQNGNNSRISISPFKSKLEDPIPPEKKIVFHEMLISELAAMRQRSSSVDQLNTRSDFGLCDDADDDNRYGDVDRESSTEEKVESMDEKSGGDKSMDDSGTGSALTLPLNVGTTKIKRARQRCPSGCSTDSSPCGPESSRIRTSDWIEVGENGKEEIMTSCHISLEDSGMEDEERPDDGSSGVGESWDSVIEAKKEEEEREMRINARRQISMADLPPLPKSLSTNLTFNEPSEENLDCENGNVTNDGNSEVIGTTLDKQLSVLRKEMYGLRQLDISLLSQLWTLNDSIQNFRTMLDDQECYSPSPAQSPSPSPYDSVSSDAEEDLSPSIQTQIPQQPPALEKLSQTPKQTKSAASTNASPTIVHQSNASFSFENQTAIAAPITTQPTSRVSVVPTPTPRSPIKTTPPTSIPRQMNSKSLPPPPAPPVTKPPVERLSIRPSQLFPAVGANKLSGGSHLHVPVPVQRMRIAPPPPPVQRRTLISPSRPS